MGDAPRAPEGGPAIVTLREVAERARVSRSAVSRTFTPGASVSARMRARVEKAAAELGYSPSVLAAALTTGRTKLIGLVSTNFQNPVFLEVFDRFTRGLQERALRPLLVNLSGGMTLERAVAMLRQYSVDGVILASSTLPAAFPLAFREAGLPVVHCFGRWQRSPAVDVVGIDNRRCGALAAETLLARGYRRIAFLGGPARATSTEDRLAGFRKGLERKAGVRLSTSFAESYSFYAGRLAMQRLLARGKPAEAYFCGDDILSIGAMTALREAGFRVPEDVGILGVNDMDMAGWPGIALTTLRQPVPEIIDASIARIADLMEDGTARPVARLFDCSVVERGTLRRG
jgi:DNA-binding LacI/PurR family transcriptional regulator